MRALDLFAGMGGASLGIHQTGLFDTITAVEYDDNLAALHDFVVPACSLTLRFDIAALDPSYFPRPDLLWASPPCQPFSDAGHRKGVADHRAHLILEPMRFVRALIPRFVVFEQVKQALPWWEEFSIELSDLGYDVWTGVLNAEQYGVPQTRQRAFLIASAVDPVTPPVPTHRRYTSGRDHVKPDDAHLPRWLSMSDVIDGDYSGVNTGRDWKKGQDRSSAQVRAFNLPAPTLTVGSGPKIWRWTDENGRHQPQNGPNLSDALAMQGFPSGTLDDWGGDSDVAFTGIGNSVPPPVAQAIVRSLISTIH